MSMSINLLCIFCSMIKESSMSNQNNLAEDCQNNFFENPGSKIDEFES